MCFPESSLLYPRTASALYRRWYYGPVREFRLPGEVSLSATVGQPILTHRSWVQAGEVVDGDYVLMSDLVCAPATSVWESWRHVTGFVIDCSASNFWGDGGGFPVETACFPRVRGGPLAMSAGMTPPVQARLVRQVLGAVTGAAVFGCSTWTRACDTVPGLAAMWPGGEPTARGAGLDAATRARLGDAVASLPEPANTTEALAERLLGASAGLRLVRVKEATTRTAQSWVVNAASDTSTLVVGGVVAGSAP